MLHREAAARRTNDVCSPMAAKEQPGIITVILEAQI
jgi:hypothetical protein